jgi:hypothetical protein
MGLSARRPVHTAAAGPSIALPGGTLCRDGVLLADDHEEFSAIEIQSLEPEFVATTTAPMGGRVRRRLPGSADV